MAILAKQAAQAAAKYYQDVTNDYNQVTVAEVELSEKGDFWLITLAHKASTNQFSGLYDDKLAFKVFKIHAKTGEVLSMKIKKV